MNRKSIAIGSVLVASLFAVGLTGPALAQTGAESQTGATTTTVDQSKIDAIHKKYDGALTKMEAQIRITERDLDQALADQDAAKASDLRQKLTDQQREYFGLRAKAWRELRDAGAYARGWAGRGGYGPYGMMGRGYGMMGGYGPYGRMGGGYGMMGGGYGPHGMMGGGYGMMGGYGPYGRMGPGYGMMGGGYGSGNGGYCNW